MIIDKAQSSKSGAERGQSIAESQTSGTGCESKDHQPRTTAKEIPARPGMPSDPGHRPRRATEKPPPSWNGWVNATCLGHGCPWTGETISP
ncbi:hypothetical protein [Desulfosporosinus nitroreducens]|uniref:hypothetical protein n=1 Tax=Desulfosporosinus nitroreducens TaxID=2018668 RepID=UPI00207C5B71|nr:hypothetical protein [Desulfosporosinus nitroreducens]MCO1603246.1 hypothetical protein [Desulfosporosinus nitroreducens]